VRRETTDHFEDAHDSRAINRYAASVQRRLTDPGLALLLALLILQCVIEMAHYRHPLITDEFYWVRKAQYIASHHRLEPADPRAIAAERGTQWGTSDWRPQGFSLFLALASGGDFSDPAGALRRRLTLIQCAGISALIVILYSIAAPSLGARERLLAALIGGLPPWPFEGITEIGTDTLNAIVATSALLLLWRWVTDQKRGTATLFVACTVAAIPLLLRPEMIATAPVMVGAALLLRRPKRREILAAFAALSIVAGTQVAYRTWFTGHPGLYGGQHIANRGAFDWATTWLGTEKEGYDFVYAVTEAQRAQLPSRAFANPDEQQRVEAIVSRVVQRGAYSAADDAEFERLAHERQARSPVSTALLRVWHTLHLWLNIENPLPLLELLGPVPRVIRRLIYGALVLLRLVILAFAAIAAVRAWRAYRAGTSGNLEALTLMAASFIVARSLLIGLVLNWKVHRYMLAAWPAMLWCAMAVCIASRSASRSASIAREAHAAAGRFAPDA
jgi:hypothetical protein